jgi:ribose 5-phosphate isomerase A
MMTDPGTPPDPAVLAVAGHAVGLVTDGAKVGLGTGRAASAFVDELGARVREGLRIVGTATSEATAKQAQALGISMIELAEDVVLDLTVDGADEVAPNLDLVKGWGGALVRERIVAAASRRQVILVGPEKLVDRLGQRGRIPVEIIPLARGLVARELRLLGLTPTVRLGATGAPFHTDNGNLTLDCAPRAPLDDGAAARALEAAILALPGVVDTGLFLGTAERVLVGHPDGRVEIRTRGGSAA